ncbi:hypothetical protein NPS01_25220 [Nocardioides psychrotolerans]|uniref:Uncharacterized protein n=1 Tax=Nocardioides psychrotolerans TaxID=1005945 RepID=A0A1I3LM09_9ACTN|nr:hypothetical protein [Nocardioides psychrotolerans]GEP38859.1 hypothetical protein NPS01_25220 [Nocardioides psychrotolerans]SFI85761.1 hypothetical protein SAMN05216561_11425 [Nocardioides psychrotolerans]
MVTQLAHIRVSRVEAGGGFTATCSTCSWRTLRPSRLGADVAGQAHQREHVTRDPTDQITAL